MRENHDSRTSQNETKRLPARANDETQQQLRASDGSHSRPLLALARGARSPAARGAMPGGGARSFALEGAQVGAFTTTASAVRHPKARGPTLALDPERGTARLEFELPAPRRPRSSPASAVAFRLARMEYRLETVAWWRVGREGDAASDPAPRILVWRLSEPPAQTTGRFVDHAPTTLVSDDAAVPTSSSSRRTSRGARGRAWGTPGEAADFTGGAARHCPTHAFAFATAEDLIDFRRAIHAGWPELVPREARRGESDDGAAGASGASVAPPEAPRGGGTPRRAPPPRLGKRDRPDGRVLQPPRKRVEIGGDEDPGFEA